MTDAIENDVPILSRLRAPEGAVRRKKRVGRGIGGGKGKTSGKGMKGQKARHPGNFGKLAFEGGQMPLWQRTPKRGFRNIFAKKVGAFNIKDLNRFEAGSEVDIAALIAVGLVRKNVDVVKCLGVGPIDRALTVKVNAFSKQAKAQIEAAGGTAEIVEIKVPAPIKRGTKSGAA